MFPKRLKLKGVLEMSIKIYIEPEDVWGFYHANPERMEKEMVVIAENEETEYAVYVTDDEGCLTFLVYSGDEEIFDDYALEKIMCTETARGIYETYLYPVEVYDKRYFPDIYDNDTPPSSESQQDMEDIVYEREDELCLAMSDFLETLLIKAVYSASYVGGDDCLNAIDIDEDYIEVISDEILDSLCRFLNKRYHISVYRPRLIEKDNKEMLLEYPYDATESDEDTT